NGQPTQYMEVVKVFDSNGNEPGKAPAQSAPMTQQPNGGWSNQQPQSQPQQAQPAPQQQAGWNNPPQQPTQQPQQAPNPGGWQQQPQGNTPGGLPPPVWAK